MNTAPADADPAVIIATNTLAVLGLVPRGAFEAPSLAEFETLCRWIVDHQDCPKPFGQPVAFDEPALPRRRFRLLRRKAAA